MIEEIEVECPSCSPEEKVSHEVLKTGQNPMVRCLYCGQVHTAEIIAPKAVTVKVIVSKKDRSFTYDTKLDSEAVVYVDDEMIVDDESTGEATPIIVTAIDTREKRVNFAKVEDIFTIWGRAIDEVTIKFSIQSGTDVTTSIEKRVPGEYEFVVGNEESIGREKVIITNIKIRDGDFRSRKGDSVLAKYVKRVFAKQKRRRVWGREPEERRWGREPEEGRWGREPKEKRRGSETRGRRR